MTLIHRVARLFRADAHALLDRIEEPELVLRQAVQEMQNELDAERRHLRLLDQELASLARRRAERVKELSRIGEQLDVCFEAGNEELARSLIRRRLEAERQDQTLAADIEQRNERLSLLKARLEENTARLEAMRQTADLLAQRDAEPPTDTTTRFAGPLVRDEEVEVALLEERRRRAAS